MYSIKNKSSAIKALQRLLFINESGEYDRETKERVSAFQADQELPVTGVVDYSLFVLIRDAYFKESEAREQMIYDGMLGFPYKYGASGSEVELLNSNLARALPLYGFYNSRLPRGGFYSADTEGAVMMLRRIYRMSEEPTVDKAFYSRMKKDLMTR